jgi:signal transduction histidine kinase/DNA-binding CsgD family transcriptional regulator
MASIPPTLCLKVMREKKCMATSDSDTLLQLVTDLQHDTTVTDGRRRLLEYIRVTSGARLALLFAFDAERQELTLLERRGYRSQQSYRAVFAAETVDEAQPERFNAKHIPAHGLFGSALDHVGLLYVPRADIDARCLRVERFWIDQHGSVMLIRVMLQGKASGVLVLCFKSGDDANLEHEHRTDARRLIQANESNLLICISLLPAFLSTPGRKQQQSIPVQQSTGQAVLQADIMAAIDQERERIAYDLHDGAVQQIAHVTHKLTFISRILEKQPAAARRELHASISLLQQSLDELRRTITSPLPLRLEKQGLAAALQALMEEYRHDKADATGIEDQPALSIELIGEDFSLIPPVLAPTLYRFVQEALSNVRKHAHATHVTVRIRVLAGLLLAEVGDDGQGFDPTEHARRSGLNASAATSMSAGTGQHLGLRVMRERIKQAGGTWEITSKRGRGTIVKARFPLAFPSPAAILTRREREVLQLLVEGLSNRAIADRLSVSPETVKSHMHSIMQKMQVHDRTQAAVAATRQRWV